MKFEYNVNDNALDVREMTAEEIKADEIHQTFVANELKTEQDKAVEKAAARQAILDRLGLTADEAAILLK
jgi:hypothetical protein